MTAAPIFSAGQLLGDRFKIVRFIGRGGMGEVYEAEDLELREHVALKTIRPDIADEAGTVDRFKREIQLARQVTHPNVCRLFDLFHHRASLAVEGRSVRLQPDLDTQTLAARDVTFVTMELLPGETLDQRLRRTGRMDTAEALPLVDQMVDGLAAAHRAGIVHRDFKSANVILAPPAPGTSGTRVVVTDFGLARRSVASDPDGLTMMATSGFVGTPAYMAPEQVEGRETTAAVDIYGLGVVLYEMMTGRLPFAGDTPLSVAVKRLTEAPQPPRRYVPGLDPTWEAVILRCLARDPADRFASAADVTRALHGEISIPAPSLQRHRRRLALVVAAVMLAVLGGTFVAFQARRTKALAEDSRTSARAIVPRRSVAVLGFKNLSGRADAAWLSSALAEMFTSELAAGEQLRTIPGEIVAQMKVNLALTDAESFGRETLARIRTNLGTDLVVLGSYVALGAPGSGQVRLDLRLQDAALGETVASVTDTGKEEDLLDLVSRAGARLRERLGVGEVPADAKAGIRAALPANSDAARAYAEGLAQLRQFDVLGARDLLEKATAADPAHALAHSALGEAWRTLGYDQKAKSAAEKAFELSKSLSREERLLVEARLRAITPQWDRAVEIYRTLWGFFPDNIEYGLGLATAQTSAGKGRDALATVAALRQLPTPAALDPRIDLADAAAATSVSDFKRAQAAAATAATKGAAHGARLLVARARLEEGWAWNRLGDLEKARTADEEAKRIGAETGSRSEVATALGRLAAIAWDRGDLELARKLGEEDLAIVREIGNERGMAGALAQIGLILHQRGDSAGAMKRFEEALAVYRRTGAKGAAATVLNNIGAILHVQGRLVEAEAKYQEALALDRETGNKRGVSTRLNNMGEVREAQGRLAEARGTYEDSLAIAREIGDKRRIGYTLTRLGGIFLLQGERASARTRLDEALAVRTAMAANGDIAETRLALASVTLEEGSAGGAEALARQAAEEFQREKMIDREAEAYERIARALLPQKKTGDARAAIERASSLAAKSQDRRVRLSIDVTRARVRAADGAAAEAIKSLESTLADAKKAGFLDLEFEVRLALGEVETRSNKSAAGLSRLAALEKDAAALGFGLIAKKAADARQSPTKR